MKKIYILIFIVVFFIVSGITWAQEERFEATLEMNRASAGNPLYLYLTFYGSRDVSRPEISSIEGLRIKYVGPSTKMTVVNGKVSRSITHMYLVIPLKSGKFDIGPFSVEYRGRIYNADAVTLTISDLPSRPPQPGPSAVPSPPVRGVPEEAPYVGDRIFLTMEVNKDQVYINESVFATIKVYVNEVGLKDIEYPAYSHEGFSAGEFFEPERSRETVHGAGYDVLVFRQHLFAIKEGDYVIGPAKLRCKMIVRKRTSRRASLFGSSIFDDDFFSSRFGQNIYPIELESKDIPISILPFPVKGRPPDFQGTVGDFDMDVSVHPAKVKVGDPITLRMVISGRGNLDTVTVPRLDLTEKFKTYEPQVTKKGGKKIYEQILIPKTDEAKEIPEVSFSFFNPSSKEYETIRKGPFPVEVVEQPASERAVKMVSMPGVEQMFYPEEKIGKDIIHIKENMGKLHHKGQFLYRNWLFWFGQFIPLALFSVFYIGHKRKERIQKDESYARFLRAPRKARNGLARAKSYLARDDILPFYDVVFKTLQEYLGDRFNLPRGSVTGQVIEDRLHLVGCDEKIMEMLREVFFRCEVARYASSVPGGPEARETLEKVRKVIAHLEKVKL
jgi:hypothetical protein